MYKYDTTENIQASVFEFKTKTKQGAANKSVRLAALKKKTRDFHSRLRHLPARRTRQRTPEDEELTSQGAAVLRFRASVPGETAKPISGPAKVSKSWQ